jgi:hypothetical protein
MAFPYTKDNDAFTASLSFICIGFVDGYCDNKDFQQKLLLNKLDKVSISTII